jgi:ATP-dependent DNA helicase RecG
LRIAVPLVPPVAVREAIANALVHRDYTRMGPVLVQLTDEALVISNPGGFPQGVRLDNLLDSSQPRSRILADAFKRAGMVERTGRGINRMYEATLRVGREAPDFTRSTDEKVTAAFATSTPDLALVRFILEREQASGSPFRLEDLQVLHELRRESSLSTAEGARLLQKTEGQTREALARMVEGGLVEARGTGRGRRYHLAAAVFRAMKEPAAYVRVRTFDTLQQEQMVLAFVDAHGSITRRQAAELCQLAPAQASALLRRLATAGTLVMVGERRGAHYVRRP